MKRAVIAVGSNIEPEKNIAAAEKILMDEQKMLGKSAFVKTSPQGFTDQDDFINGAFYIETPMELETLRAYCKAIESRLGRVRTQNKNGPRTIDLDVTVFEGRIVDGDFYRYDFVRDAVLEVMPELEGESDGNQ